MRLPDGSLDLPIGESAYNAFLSRDRVYRYWLKRAWYANVPRIAFIGLNPSTADEKADDATVRRCIGFARTWGYGGFYLLNLFAFRARDQIDLWAAGDSARVGPENDAAIVERTADVGTVVCAWGSGRPGNFRDMVRERSRTVLALLRKRNICHLGLTSTGFPRHPLYLRGDVVPQVWRR